MSALQPLQFPFYNKLASNYDAGSQVRPENFGLQVREKEDGLRWSKGDDREIDVPLNQVRARQDYVYDKHVQNLAAVPQHAFHKIHAVPEVYEHHDGTYRINEGTHRAAAAHVRGDETLRVRVTGRWDKA